MKDYRVQIKVKNNRLMTAIESCGYASIPQFAEANGLTYSTIMQYIGMKISPFRIKGELKSSARTLCEALRVMPSDIFNYQQMHNPIIDNKTTLFLGEDELNQLSEGDTSLAALQNAELGACLDVALSSLTDRELEVVERHTIGGDTLKDVADHLGVSPERVRQIEAKALRALRHPSKKLEAFL